MANDYRTFWLENSLGKILFLSDDSKSKIFLNNPTGLGFSKNISGYRYGNRIKQNKKNTYYNFTKVGGELVYYKGDNAGKYEDYYNFIDFIRFSPLKLYQQRPGSNTIYYIDCDIESCEKSEIKEEDSLMRCQISVQPFSFWQDKMTNYIKAVPKLSPGAFTFPLSVPFSFGSNSLGEIKLENHGMVDTGLLIHIVGLVNNPVIRFFNNDVEYGIVRLLGEFDEVSIDSGDDKEEIILKKDGVTLSNPINYQDLSIGNPEKLDITFVRLRPGDNTLTITSNSDFNGYAEFSWRNEYVSV